MGVPGLTLFVKNHELIKRHKLHNTTVIVDGNNLSYSLYFKYQNSSRNNHIFGGDYSLWAVHVSNFFRSLMKCGVHPIVVLDGSFDPSNRKLNTKVGRMETSLRTTYQIYKHNTFDEGIVPLMNLQVFTNQIHEMDLRVYQSTYEADDVILKMASDLCCPVMTDDSDFFVELLSAGVISIHSLLDDFRIITDDDGTRYHLCTIFHYRNFVEIYPHLNEYLIPAIGVLLGNDYLEHEAVQRNLRRILRANYSTTRQVTIGKVIEFLASCNQTEDLLEHFSDQQFWSSLLQTRIRASAERLKNSGSKYNSAPQNVSNYCCDNEEAIFNESWGMPDWLVKLFVSCQVQSRLLSIYLAHVDFLKPLIEDFSINDSSSFCALQLCEIIYGLLRGADVPRQYIMQYRRIGTNFVMRRVNVSTEFEDGSQVPSLAELADIDLYSPLDRYDLYKKYLRLPPKLITDIDKSLAFDKLYDMKYFSEFGAFLTSLWYFLVHFEHPVWIEFVYALYLNIMLCGHFCGDPMPKLVKLSGEESGTLRQTFAKYCKQPEFSQSKVYVPRVIHFYNAFQSCVVNINLLTQVLNVEHLQMQHCFRIFKGTFIYNMTIELLSRPKPLLYVRNLVNQSKLNPMFELLETLLASTKRVFATSHACDGDVIPVGRIRCIPLNQLDDQPCLVRAAQVSNRKTHIRAQNLKVRT